MYFFVTTYQGTLPELGKAPKIRTRVDQPGSTIYPMATIPESIDGENSIKLDSNYDASKKEYEGSKTAAYVEHFKSFASNYLGTKDAVDEDGKVINGDDGKPLQVPDESKLTGVDCKQSGDPLIKTCKMSDVNQITEAKI